MFLSLKIAYKKKKDCFEDISKKCIDEQVHSDNCTRFNTNQFRFKTVNKQNHPI